MKTITMPSFGADMEQGKLTEWNVKPGDTVHKGDIIATIETMKGLIDMEVFDDGVIEQLLIKPGSEVPVGEPIATLRRLGDVAVETPPVKAPLVEKSAVPFQTDQAALISSPPPETTATIATQPDLALSAKQGHQTSPLISPAARHQAEQQSINWRALPAGSGPNGAIVLADLERYIQDDQQQSNVTTPTTAPHSIEQDINALKMRQAIAAVVSQSKREIPHYYLSHDISLTHALQWLKKYNEDRPPESRILINALIYCAIAKALQKFPAFNGFYQNNQFQPAEQVHLGNAINLRQGGLMVAAIHNAETLSPVSMMDKLKDQVVRAREGHLKMSEMQDATITISNLGDRGSDSILGVIFPPQVALLGIGRVREVAWVEGQHIKPVTIVSISLAADHRVTDGHDGARLLNKINKLLQKPEQLV
ncbi:dihydrolipoamide acetyltransferase family protein [Zooshikella ganghwensis]|uniref:Dihydrolipoamide acetyltransferase component of pyruvate dehydrogenase complex n=1 Tax=Zooshikella ganghwensis TaxID=202772 RepID=A0A4P9VNQ5_9GAMM|nr:dihydrolipoamide acetyltransferase family protein [Zooshikella ganghwensis]RDH44107.1 2-oxo acid dehydrogenase subunit E2 [Zooshikella ganghwensis]